MSEKRLWLEPAGSPETILTRRCEGGLKKGCLPESGGRIAVVPPSSCGGRIRLENVYNVK